MNDHFRIISTLGPASANERFVRACVEIGQAHFRLNGSHLDVAGIESLVRLVSQTADDAEWEIVLDLQGDKRRVGELPEPIACPVGAELSFALGETAVPGVVPVPHRELFAIAEPADALVLQDGAVRLEVLSRAENELRAIVRRGGELRARCGIHIHGKSMLHGDLPAEQLDQIRVAAEVGVQTLALSYVRRREELDILRRTCVRLDYSPSIVAKVERPEAFDDLDAICDAADELWLCRGDLGALVALRTLGALQRQALRVANAHGCPLVVAGQVFEHLTEHPQPTRTEVVHLHEIREQGAVAIVLSDETAIGVDPENAVRSISSVL